MNRDEVIFYFKSLKLVFVLLAVIQVAIGGVLAYQYFTSEQGTLLAQIGIDSQTMMFFLIVPLLILSGGSLFFRKQMAKAVKVLGVEKKMVIYRKALIVNWMACVVAALIVGFIFYATYLIWVPIFSVFILVYYFTTNSNPIKLAKQLQLSRGELVELQRFYKNVAK